MRSARAAFRSVGAALFAGVAGCASAAPAVASPAAPSASAAPPQPAASPSATVAPGYERESDPGYVELEVEKDPYWRHALAAMWLAVARAESSPTPERVRAASEALREEDGRLASLARACEPLRAAAARARSRKDSFERQYLELVQVLGERHADALEVDARIHALRDEIESLERAAAGCPRAVFEPGGIIR
jgi:hypothetical protein